MVGAGIYSFGNHPWTLLLFFSPVLVANEQMQQPQPEKNLLKMGKHRYLLDLDLDHSPLSSTQANKILGEDMGNLDQVVGERNVRRHLENYSTRGSLTVSHLPSSSK